jgi:hypothetical protein
VRGIVSVLVTFGCLWILAAQLMAGAANPQRAHRRAALARLVIGGGIMTVYFAAAACSARRS